MADDLALALELADLADEITIGRFRAGDLLVDTKPDMTPVTEADRAVEKLLRDRLSARRPDDAVAGEEFGVGGDGSGRRWIIDPIDGTKGYVRGMPIWATLLALEIDGEASVGVVSAPALGRRWWSSRGEGAWLADGLSESPRRLHASGVTSLEDAQLCYGGLDDWKRLDDLLSLARRCWRTRGVGDVWSYMLVAEGAAEIGLDPVVALWDLAAPRAIVLEAGGRFTDFSGAARADGGSGVATNGLLHDQVLEIIGS
ncbi:MAG TPA: inositol monophosphatase family protein [Solirubrobacteraceae bacterium]|nr:inositol monophosphatase family protein [Solirubrobacteraceae bacterium]